MLLHVLNTALPVFAALFLGVLCRKRAILDRGGVDALKRVAVDICLPAVLFAAFASAEYSAKSVLIPLVVFVLCVAALLLGYLAKRLCGEKSSLMPFLMTGFEAGMLGYGLFALLYPGESNAAFAIVDLGQVLFVFTLYKGLLYGKSGAKELVRQTLRSPVIWAILAGIVFGASGLYAWLGRIGAASVLDGLTDFISAPTSCIILITIGFDLMLARTPWRRVLKYTGIRVVIMALLYAAAGGLLAFGAMFALKKCLPGRLSPVGLSIAGAAAHHAGQVGVACLILGSTAPLAFLPFLLGVSLPTGALTGALCIALGRAVKREE